MELLETVLGITLLLMSTGWTLAAVFTKNNHNELSFLLWAILMLVMSTQVGVS